MPLNEFDAILANGKPTAGNEYDAMLGEQADSQQLQMRSSMTAASRTTPDRAAKVIELSKKTNLPPNIVERNFDTIMQKQQVEGNDYEAMIRETPKLAAWLSEGENAAVAADDMKRMGTIEWLVSSPSKAWNRGQAQVEFGRLRSQSIMRDMTAAETKRLDELRAIMGEGGDLGAEGWFGNAYVKGIQQIPQLTGGLMAGARTGLPMSATFATAATIAGQVGPQVALPEEVVTVPAAAAMGYYIGSTQGAATFGYEQEAGQAYEEFSKFKDETGAPLDRNIARAAAIAAGAINSGLEAFQINTLMRSIPGADKLYGAVTRSAISEALKAPTVRAALGTLMTGYAGTLTAETVTEVAQRAVTILSGELGKVASGQKIAGRTGPDVLGDLASEGIDAAQAFMYIVAPGHVARMGQDAVRIREAKKQEAFFTALGENVADSKTFQRLPEKMQEFVERATKEGPIETVYVPVDSWVQYWQSQGLDPAKAAEQVTGDSTLYESAVNTGTDIAIPMGAYATRLAPTEHNAFFAKELRLAPDEMNSREAVEFEQELAAEQKASQAAAEDAAKSPLPPLDDAVKQVQADVEAKLVQSGVEPATAKAYAETHAAMFRSIGERAGVDPAALYEGYGLKIGRGEPQPGETAMSQVADDKTPLAAGPFAGISREQFLGSPKITKDANAADLKPKAITDLTDAPSEPFMGRYEAKYSSDGAAVFDGGNIIASYNFGDTLAVDKKYRRLGIGEELVYQWRTRNPGAKPAGERTKASQALQEKVWERIATEAARSMDQSAIPATISVNGQDRPTTNSNGAPIAQTLAEIEAFYAWFGDSKVVDEHGRPLVVYHYGYFNAQEDGVFDTSMGAHFGTKTAAEIRQGGKVVDDIISSGEVEQDAETGRWHWSADGMDSYDFNEDGFDTESEARSDMEENAVQVGENQEEFGGEITSVYLSIQNPAFTRDAKDDWTAEVEAAKASGHDGILYKNEFEDKGSASWIAFDPTQIKSAEDNIGTFDPLSGNILHQPAYHGSPHDFTKFSTEKIGTGEGAQAYGWGLYFAENPGIASGYHERLAGSPQLERLKLGTMDLTQRNNFDYSRRASDNSVENVRASLAEDLLINEMELRGAGDAQAYVLKVLDDRIANYYDAENDQDMIAAAKALRKELARKGAVSAKWEKATGGVYQVDISDEAVARMLDWDAPLSAQKPEVREIVSRIAEGVLPARTHDYYAVDGINVGESSGDPALEIPVRIAKNGYDATLAEYEGRLSERMAKLPAGHSLIASGEKSLEKVKSFAGKKVEFINEPLPFDLSAYTGDELYNALAEKMGQEKASKHLLSLGIAGVKYADGSSRSNSGYRVTWANGKKASDLHRLLDHAKFLGESYKADYGDYTVDWEQPGDVKRNLVVFDDRDIKLTHKDGSPVTDAERKEYLQTQKQNTSDAKRGRIRFGADRKFSIDLLEAADLSTFIHESGHFWLEVMGDIAQQLRVGDQAKLNDKQRRMLADYDTLLKWFGVESRAQIGVEQHEQFARGIESYFMEGKAPSEGLREVFARVRAWMLSIYRSMKQLNVTISPEVRDVFDRMFATDQEIEAAQSEAKVDALFMDASQAGMTDIEFSAYRKKLEQASTRARDELQAKLMRTLQREREAWWKSEREKERAEIAAEIAKRPEYLALSVLQSDKMPDGEPMPYDLGRVKLDRATLADLYGEDFYKTLPRGVTAATGGITADTAAEMFGFASGSDLVQSLRTIVPMRQAIEAATDARMKEKHGDMLVDGTMVDAARAAVQNEDRVKVIEAELRALAKLRRGSPEAVTVAERTAAAEAARVERERAYERRWLDAERKLSLAIERGALQSEIDTLRAELKAIKANQRKGQAMLNSSATIPPLDRIRVMAAGRIAQTRVRDIRPSTYLIAARKASQGAIRAAGAQDFEEAIRLKQRELMNVELFRAATKAIEGVDKTVDYMRKFSEAKVRGRIALAGQDYLDQIDGFLDRYEFSRIPLKSLDRRKALAQWVADKERAGEPVDLPDSVVVENRVNYKDMTVEELRGVSDSVRQIEHLAKLKNRLLTAKRNRDLEQVTQEIGDSIRANAKGTKEQSKETRLPGDSAARLIDGWFGSHRKIASIARELDGHKDGGPLWEYVIRPINEAGDREATKNAEATAKLSDLFSVYTGKEMRELYVKTPIPAIGESLTKMARIVVALNQGNADNKAKIMEGYGWNEDQVAAILDTLDERDWKFVQGVWDYIDSYWPEIEAKEKRVKGVAPAKVERSTVKTRFGDLAGGYYPIKYDNRQDLRAESDMVKEAAEMMMKVGYGSSTTKRGHTKARVEGVRRPMRLDLGVIFEHTSQVVHDVTHHETLIDVNRIINNKTVSSAVMEHYGRETLDQFASAVRDIAAGQIVAEKTIEQAVNWVRTGVSIAAMGWNVMTAMMQPFGLSQSMVRIGPKWVGLGLSRWLRDSAGMENSAVWIREKSEFMRNRGNTQMREINEIRNHVGLSSGKLVGWMDQAISATTFDTVTRQGIADSYFWLIQKSQQIADFPTWIGAYEKALAAKETDERAVALADQAVLDSQGGGQMKDLASIQRGGPLLKLWTNFYSYFNVTHNLMSESISRASIKDPISIGRTAVDFLMLYTVPATLTYLMKNALVGNDEGDDLRKAVITENVSYMLGSMILMRELGSAIQGYSGYGGPAGAGFFTEVGKLIKQTGQGEADPAFWRALNSSAGILFHYPAGQIKRTMQGAAALYDGQTRNPLSLLVGAPKQ